MTSPRRPSGSRARFPDRSGARWRPPGAVGAPALTGEAMKPGLKPGGLRARSGHLPVMRQERTESRTCRGCLLSSIRHVPRATDAPAEVHPAMVAAVIRVPDEINIVSALPSTPASMTVPPPIDASTGRSPPAVAIVTSVTATTAPATATASAGW